MRAVLVAGGEPMANDAAWLADAQLLVAADEGAAWLLAQGVQPDAVIGDFDSLDPSVQAELTTRGVRLERHPSAKDASDTELALAWAVGAGATEVIVLGALAGERIDHELANVLLLAKPAGNVPRTAVRLARGGTSVRAVRDGERVALDARVGDTVSLLPVGDAAGVRVRGLRYRLEGEPLAAGSTRGLSNEVVEDGGWVSVEAGTLLVIETRRQEE